MKHIPLFAGLLFCTTAAFAQRSAAESQIMKLEPASERAATIAKQLGAEVKSQARGGGSMLFQETFSNGFDGSNGNGAWTPSDNQDGSLWIWVTPTGQGQYLDETSTGSAHPGGFYSGNSGTLESSTASDGWMIFDCDFFQGGQINELTNPIEYPEGALTSPFLDFSSEASVIVTWESYFRYCCQQAAPVQLEVGSTADGVATWTSFEGHGDFIQSGNTPSANPLTVSLDVSCVAANQDSVQLRFAYRQQFDEPAYSHYFWGIDDVVVTSYPEENDLEITQVTNGDITTLWEYRITPWSRPLGPPMTDYMESYKNVGTETQTNVTALVEILDDNNEVIFDITETIDTIISFGQSPECPPASEQGVYISTGWVPDAPGDYFLRRP